MATHTREQFAWIVSQRATYVSPDAIVAEFVRRWKDTACSLEDVARSEREVLPEDWQKFFDEQREAFLNSPTADKRVRIAELNRMFVVARDRGAVQTAAELLEQIAKEEAGAYAPKGMATGKGGSDNETPEFKAVEVRRSVVHPAPQSATE
jgi:hypothetical protein